MVQTVNDKGDDRIWVDPLSGNTQLRELATNARNPVWTRDHLRITFDGTRDGVRGVYWQRADGTDTPELLLKSSDDKPWLPQSWSPDGRVLLVSDGSAAGGIRDVFAGHGEGSQLLPDSTDTLSGGAVFSPDGKWIAYHRFTGARTGAGPTGLAVHVQPYPPTGAEYRVSPEPRIFPSWRQGTNEIVYAAGLIGDELDLASTSVSTNGSFSVGKERILPAKISGQVLQRSLDTDRDGILIVVASQTNVHPQLNVVINWFDELLKRVPVQ